MKVVPPGTGICHQVNLEYLAKVVWTEQRRRHRVPRLARRHRLAHHDGQRPRRVRLGRRRHRGRGRHARPADGDADPRGRRLRAHRPAARRARPRPTSCSRSPRCCARRAWSTSSSSSTARASRALVAARPRDDREHGAGVRRDDGLLPGRRRDARLPALHRPPRGARRAGRALLQGEHAVARPEAPSCGSPTRCRSTSSTVEPSLAGPGAPAGSRAAQDVAPRLAQGASAACSVTRPAPTPAAIDAWARRRRRHRRPASSPPPKHVTTDHGTFDARPRLGRDRRDHELHEHLEPVGADRRGPARAEGGRQGPHHQAVGEDLARARLAGRHRLPRPRPA